MTASRNPFILTINHNNLITSQFVSTVTYKVIQKPFWTHLCGLVNVQHSNCYKHTMISLLCRFCNDYVSHVKNELGASSFPVKIDILRINKSSQKLLKHLIMSSFKMWMLLASHANSSPSTWAGGEGGRWGLGQANSPKMFSFFFSFFLRLETDPCLHLANLLWFIPFTGGDRMLKHGCAWCFKIYLQLFNINLFTRGDEG